MANKRIYTKIEIEAIKQGLNHYFPYELGEASGPKIVDDKWSDLNKIFRWMGRDDFFTTLSESTGIQKLSFTEIKGASGILEKMERSAPETTEFKSAEESPVQANRPSKGTLEQMEEENQIKEAKRKEILEQSNRDVRAAIEKQKENYAEQIQKAKIAEAALKDKKIYYKVEKGDVNETQEIKSLRQQAQADPKKFIEDTAKEYAKNPNIKNLTAEEMDVVTKQAGVTSYDVLTGNSPLTQSAIVGRVMSDPKFLDSIPDAQTRESVKNIADILINQKNTQFELSKQFIDFSKIDGYKNANDIKIWFSDTPQPGFKEFDFNNQVITPHIENLNQQSYLLDTIKGFGEGEIKSQLLLRSGNVLNAYMTRLPVNSLLAKTYNSEIVQLGLSSFGVVPAVPWTAIEGSWIGKITIGSGYGNVAGFIQAKTGINLGVKLATKTGAETAVKAGVTTVAKTGFKAAFSKITAAAASIIPVPVLNWIAGWVAGELLVKIAEKIPWKKIKEFSAVIIGGIMGLVVLPFIGIGGAVGIGLGAAGVAAVFGGGVGGLTLAGFGRGILNFFKIMAGATLGAIGVPILITLIVFPLIVALILFIINSGAYVVPPDSALTNSTNPFISVQKTANPSGQLGSPQTITYTITITAKKDTLTGITFKNTCTAIKKAGGNIDCKNLEQIPAAPTSIIPSAPFTFTFTSKYDAKFQDSLVSDIITVSAKSNEGGAVSDTGSASICFGNCPLDCFAFPDKYWPNDSNVQNLKSLLTGAASTLASKYPNFAQKACADGAVNLCYNPGAFSSGVFGFHEHSNTCDIDFNIRSAAYGQEGVLFLLTHEAAHHIQKIAPNYTVIFADTVAPTEPSVCSYGGSVLEESMAEGTALYVAKPIIDTNGSCITNYQSQYPRHYKFARDVMFGP